MRDVLDAIFYVLRTGCQWRFLPKDFPPKSTVWGYFHQWRRNGTLEHIHDRLRDRVRRKEKPGHPGTPPASTANRSTPAAAARRSAGTTTRTSTAASGISSWIAWVCCWP
jgi:putative transposase